MKMIVGLGNPGQEYARTKHNVGFMTADALAHRLNTDGWRQKEHALVAEARLGGEKIIIVKPLTYMNESGRAVRPLADWYKLATEEITVIHDDMDIPVGTIRLRKKGGDGGHNGIKSVLAYLGEENFNRIRLGIGRPPANWSVINHVLSPFNPDDIPLIEKAIEYLLPAIECIITDGIDLAMNRYNPKKVKKPKEKPTEKTGDDTAAGSMEKSQAAKENQAMELPPRCEDKEDG